MMDRRHADFTSSFASLSKVHYWKEGQAVQNFGDFLSEFFMQHLFLPTRLDVRGVHLVGSVLDDMFIPSAEEDSKPVVFWGCGLRNPGGLSMSSQERTRILAVRGPLSRSHLRLGAQIPIGDPGFLLPALYQPKPDRFFENKTLCIPHFHDDHDDEALLALSECDLVLRPAISATCAALEAFIDAVVAADFVLTASLHGAVVAAAYGRPFAFWSTGAVDLPFKWEDLAASMEVECVFHTSLQPSRSWYEAAKPKIRLPEAWRLLLNPPLPLRAQAVVQVVKYYCGDHFEKNLSISEILNEFNRAQGYGSQMALEMAELIENADIAFDASKTLNEALVTERAATDALQEKQNLLELEAERRRSEQDNSHRNELSKLQKNIDNERSRALSLAEEVARYQVEQKTLQQSLNEEQTKAWSLRRELSSTHEQIAHLTALHSKDMTALNHEREWLQEERQRSEAFSQTLSQELAAVYASTSWRATALARRLAASHPFPARNLRRIAKLAWWIITGRLRQRLRQRSAIIAQTKAHAASPTPLNLVVSHQPRSFEPSFCFDTPGRPKALFIDSRYPRIDRDSGSVDTRNMIEILHSFGYEVAFIATAEFHEINSYGQLLQADGVKIITSNHFDSVQSFLKKHGREISLGILSRVDCGGHFVDDMRRLAPQARVVFNTVDLHHVREEREAILKNDRAIFNEAYRMEERERYVIRMADITFVVSSFDEARCRELVPGADVVLLPILRKIPGRQTDFGERSGIGFIGGFEHKPNLDAVAYFLDEIWPRLQIRIPGITFHVIGADMPESMKELSVPGVEMVGFVPEIDPWLNRLRLTVAPLRFGAGAKGKVVSSFSFGVPCVMSTIAAEGMGIEGEAEALVAKDPDSYVEIIGSLYDDAVEWRRLSDSCIEIVEAQNSLSHGSRIFEKVLTRLDLPTGSQGVSL